VLQGDEEKNGHVAEVMELLVLPEQSNSTNPNKYY
jgi:hypothetical protein